MGVGPRTHLAAVALTVVLTMALVPTPACADEADALTAGTATARDEGTAAVWVRSDLSNLKYGKNGLVSRYSYEYNGMAGKGTAVESFKYDKKGRLARYTWKLSKMKSAYNTWVLKYDKRGRLVKRLFYYKKRKSAVILYKYSNGGRTVRSTSKWGDYDKTVRTTKLSKSGRVSSVKDVQYYKVMVNGRFRWVKHLSGKFAYTYDAHGNVTKRKGDFSAYDTPYTKDYGNATYRNAYDENGLLESREVVKGSKTGEGYGYLTGSFSFKLVNVPKAYAGAVESQQRDLSNPSLLAPRLGLDYYLGRAFAH